MIDWIDYDKMEKEEQEAQEKFTREMKGREKVKVILASPRIMRETSPNADYRQYHGQMRLVKQGEWFSPDSMFSNEDNGLDKLTTGGLDVLRQVQNIDAVTSISIREGFELSIVKGMAFHWRDIQKDIMAILKIAFHKEEVARRRDMALKA